MSVLGVGVGSGFGAGVGAAVFAGGLVAVTGCGSQGSSRVTGFASAAALLPSPDGFDSAFGVGVGVGAGLGDGSDCTSGFCFASA